jgi:hypothetical protein
MLKELNLPEYSFKIIIKDGNEMILDTIRRKYVKYTPEERVRQNFIRYLADKGKYPPGLMKIEARIRLNRLDRRIDILVHDRSGQPVMIVECKKPDIGFNEKISDQIMNYNRNLKLPYIVVTNGIYHYAYKYNRSEGTYKALDYIPLYEDLLKEEEA